MCSGCVYCVPYSSMAEHLFCELRKISNLNSNDENQEVLVQFQIGVCECIHILWLIGPAVL